ncbi:MAG: hypothetical protein B0D91_14455 [Oceanospirillales bacterium LUC14_002_19_P2]|nr:MAG: hypothetical protein B0D91_14455 [Oceanospirillales bacterium LUC14_002_19_P2]
MMDCYLTPSELARRWNFSERSLGVWRVNGQGPRYLKIGNRIRYRVEDVEAWEQAHMYRQVGQPPVGTEDKAPCH